MGVYNEDNKFVIIAKSKTFHFDLPEDFGNNLKHETDSIIKYIEILAEHTIRNVISRLLSKYKYGNDFHMNTENRKISKPHKFFLNLAQRLDFRSSNKHVALQNVSIYYTWKNIRQQYKNNKLKVIAPTWNDEFELTHGSY